MVYASNADSRDIYVLTLDNRNGAVSLLGKVSVMVNEVAGRRRPDVQCSFNRGRTILLTWPTTMSAVPLSQPWMASRCIR